MRIGTLDAQPPQLHNERKLARHDAHHRRNPRIGVIPGAGTKLAVNGKITAAEVVVTSSPGADHVFSPEYRVASLKEVADFVAANQHLPGIPSAAEMQTQGVDLAQVQSKLLAKIEELTVHLIDADQRMSRLEQEIANCGPW